MAQLRSLSSLVAAITCALAIGAAGACSDSPELGADDAGASSSSGSSSSSSSGAASSSSSSGGGSSGHPDPSYADAPVLTSITPMMATVGSAGPTLVVRGKSFVQRTIVQLDGAQLETSFIDTTEIRATLPTEKLAAPGTLVLTVGTSPPGGGASSSLDFTVENPAPTLTRVSAPDPASAPMGGAALAITLEGGGFVQGAKVRWQGGELPTTFTSATVLQAQVGASLLVNSGVFELDVLNPAPGGGASAKLTFTVTNPTVQLTSIAPSSANVGSVDLPLALTGNGFVAGKSTVYFNNQTLVPTVTSGTDLTVTVPAALLASVGLYSVSVLNPNPGGGLSVPLTFNVVNPAPSMTSLTPNAVTAGSGATHVVITGRNFLPTSQVTIDNDPTATTFVPGAANDAATLEFDMPMARLATARTLDVRVENFGPGGGTANLPFSVRNGAAVLDDVVADDQLASLGFVIGQPVDVVLKGSGFVLGASVPYLDGAPIALGEYAVVSSTKITATVTPTAAAMAFQVFTDPAMSNTIGLTACTMTAAAQALPGLDIVLNSSSLFLNGPTKLFSGSSGKACGPAVTFRSTLKNYSAFIVQNTSGKNYALEAYASCSGAFDDAYLAFYHRDTVPVTDADRQACATVVSDGAISGSATPYTNATKYGTLVGANSGNSAYCPGLTTDNGGAAVINACETYVAYIQADTTAHTPPQALTLNLWPLP